MKPEIRHFLVVKYGGNAMTDPECRRAAAADIAALRKRNVAPVVVHGGGPYIRALLDGAGIATRFARGHRITDERAARFVEMALSGEVNGMLVSAICAAGGKAVGLSGKDAAAAKIRRRFAGGEDGEKLDIGFVGDLVSYDTGLIELLCGAGYIPVVSPVSMDSGGDTYNVNADMFAGVLAGELQARTYVALTNVSGLRRDRHDPDSRIDHLTPEEARRMLPDLEGGMIPKVDSCIRALEGGAETACIGRAGELSLTGLASGDDHRCTTIAANRNTEECEENDGDR